MTDSPTVPAETSLPLPSQAGPTTDRTTAPPTRQVPLASRPTLAGEASPAGRTTPTALEIRPVLGIGEITAGTDLAEVIATAAPWLADGDVLVVTSKIVSKAEGRLVALPAHGPARDAARDAALASETAEVIAQRGHTQIVRTHHGFVLASAGIDSSNVSRTQLVLLPSDPDLSARQLRRGLRHRTGKDLAIIISDTMGRPWRNGLTDVALGAAGIAPLRDHRGEVDPYGNELHLTQMAVVDELAGAAELVKGKRDQVPVAVVRGYFDRPHRDDDEVRVLVRAAEQDLFRLGSAEARAAGLREAATLGDAGAFTSPSSPSHPATRAVPAPDRGRLAAIVATVASAADPVTVVLEEGCPDQTDLPRHTLAVVSLGLPEPARPRDHLCAGITVQRLRAALAADGFASILVRADLLAVGLE